MEKFYKDVEINGELSLKDVPTTTQNEVLTIGTNGVVGKKELNDDKHYTHDQGLTSSIWVIAHNLGKNPSATVVDTAGSVVIGQIEHTDENNLIIKFNFPFSGKAHLN